VRPAQAELTSATLPLPRVLSPCVADCLPLKVGNHIASTTRERHDVILPVARARTCRLAGRGARVLPLKFVLNLQRPLVAASRSEDLHQRLKRCSAAKATIGTNATPHTSENEPLPLGRSRVASGMPSHQAKGWGNSECTAREPRSRRSPAPRTRTASRTSISPNPSATAAGRSTA
jgi:hypothetical protein